MKQRHDFRNSSKPHIFDSNIYIDMIFTLHKNLVYGKIGAVKNAKTKEEIIQKIKATFN